MEVEKQDEKPAAEEGAKHRSHVESNFVPKEVVCNLFKTTIYLRTNYFLESNLEFSGP